MPLSPQLYIKALKTALKNSQIVQEWSLISEQTLADRGHFRVRFILINSDFVEASEFFFVRETGIEQHRYRYQWMDQTKTKLKRRWDNAPHFPEVSTFPHHVHIDQEDRVFASTLKGILDLLEVLEKLIL